MAKIYYQTQ